MMQVNVWEAKNRLSELVKAAAAGEDVVIANRGAPMVRLVAVESADHRGNGSAIVDWLHAHPAPPHVRRSAAVIDDAIRSERDGWE